MNALGRKWMSKDLYEKCEICKGTGALAPDRTDLRITLCRGQTLKKRSDGQYACPCCDETGFMRIGLTVGQVEKMRAELDRFKAGAPV
jgi:hypothetical protein